MPAEPTIPTSLITVLIVAVTALAGCVAFLFKHYQNKLAEAAAARQKVDEAISQERIAWASERARFETVRATIVEANEKIESDLRLEFEAKHRVLLEQYTRMMADANAAARDREDAIRREYTLNMELVADKAEKSAGRVAVVLDKFYDRYVSPRSRVKG